jgi:hypothetical protein
MADDEKITNFPGWSPSVRVFIFFLQNLFATRILLLVFIEQSRTGDLQGHSSRHFLRPRRASSPVAAKFGP